MSKQKALPVEPWVFEPKPENETAEQALQRMTREASRYAAQQLADRYIKIRDYIKEKRREG